MQVHKEDLILPIFLLVLGVALLIIAIIRGGVGGAMPLAISLGALVSFAVWVSSIRTTRKRDEKLKQEINISPKTINITPVVVFAVITIGIVNGVIRFSLEGDERAAVGAFIAVTLIGFSISQFWELWHDWKMIRQNHR